MAFAKLPVRLLNAQCSQILPPAVLCSAHASPVAALDRPPVVCHGDLDCVREEGWTRFRLTMPTATETGVADNAAASALAAVG